MAMLTQTLSLDRLSSGAERCIRDPSYLSGGNEDCYELNLSKLYFGGLSDDEEIGVFSADKYFNEKLDDEKPAGVIKFSPVQNDSVLSCVIPKTQSGNTSVSSWSSQSALLPVRNSLVNGASKLRGRSYLGSFRCRCVCSDKNSVAVDEYQSCNDVLRSAAKEPVKRCVSTVTAESQCIMLNQGPKRETYSSSKELSIRDLPMIPRKSLEVFGSPMYKPFSFEMGRKLTMNREDGLSRPAEIFIPTVASGAYAESDSDASSDLFEIEDFTSKADPFLSRNMSGSATPTDAYAPSEASIEWSVVTASAADFPVTSDYDELRSGKSIPYRKKASTGMNQKITATSDKPRRLSSSFLACNSQDSVKVVDHAHASPTNGKMPETKIHKSQEVPAKVFRPQTEARLTGFDPAKNVRLGISSRSLAQLNSQSHHGYLQ